jgi:hypothetical protein
MAEDKDQNSDHRFAKSVDSVDSSQTATLFVTNGWKRVLLACITYGLFFGSIYFLFSTMGQTQMRSIPDYMVLLMMFVLPGFLTGLCGCAFGTNLKLLSIEVTSVLSVCPLLIVSGFSLVGLLVVSVPFAAFVFMSYSVAKRPNINELAFGGIMVLGTVPSFCFGWSAVLLPGLGYYGLYVSALAAIGCLTVASIVFGGCIVNWIARLAKS